MELTGEGIWKGKLRESSTQGARVSALADRETSKLFEFLVQQHQKKIYRFAYRLTGNADDAEDLVQETLVEAFQSFQRFKVGTHFDRWVYRIMINTHIDRIRKTSRVRVLSLDEVPVAGEPGSFKPEVPDLTGKGPEETALSQELHHQVQEALCQLPETYRIPVVLCDIEGLSYEEIAEILHLPIGTVRSRIHRGRARLAQLLQPYMEQEGGLF